MVEQIIIGGLFIGALIYVFRIFKNSFSKEGSACAKNCGTGACAVKSFEENLPKIHS
jgi:hypothetical protein